MGDRAIELRTGHKVTWRVLDDGQIEVLSGLCRTIMHPATFRQRYKVLGSTGHYPGGQYGGDDEGEIAMAIAADPKARKVRIDFGKPVGWLALDPEQADALALGLQEKARLARGG